MRDLAYITRMVVKLGTNVLTSRAQWQEGLYPSQGRRIREGEIDLAYLYRVADQVSGLVAQGKQVLLVSSGAIGMGARELGLDRRVSSVQMRQACAAIGQPLLMDEYRRVFSIFGLTVAQILITRDTLNNRTSYNNLRSAVERLLQMRVIPIFNENDTVSTAEIGSAFGDNDQLSALVASKIDAELLILLSDIDALYDQDPRVNHQARPIRQVHSLSPEIYAAAGDNGSEFSTGGMKTKLKAVTIARDAGCSVILAHGRTPDILPRLVAGEDLGTLFDPAEPLKNRIRWLKNAIPSGSITVDQGALQAMRDKKSLLPRGVVSVQGVFEAGSVIQVNDIAHILCAFSSEELRLIQGKHSQEIPGILGPESKDLLARPEDTVFLDT
ncbi:glutamate 5-kinase [Spirochaeta lutea]|uniref:Glutamate 5-kinase n=1 Tax=Spirochaeta lutea TaxID=1480694 RepID=A0A098QYW2_9SPIO|nr:glutamate 5-kinase [Spirochaeta lutea]KGE72721.1 glutamate 5-kinase [Spirochaeta lutea]